jgi:hypothetical protein
MCNLLTAGIAIMLLLFVHLVKMGHFIVTA